MWRLDEDITQRFNAAIKKTETESAGIAVAESNEDDESAESETDIMTRALKKALAGADGESKLLGTEGRRANSLREARKLALREGEPTPTLLGSTGTEGGRATSKKANFYKRSKPKSLSEKIKKNQAVSELDQKLEKTIKPVSEHSDGF